MSDSQPFNNIVDYGSNEFVRVSRQIASLCDKDIEQKKIAILVNYSGYLDFLSIPLGFNHIEVTDSLRDYAEDDYFHRLFSDKLVTLNQYAFAGDLRFHAVSIYSLVRLLKPRIVVETGVAFGKSTACALLALHHNAKGILYSFDLPNKPGNILLDGSKTTTEDKAVGYLVPSYLKGRWRLTIGDSLKQLPIVLKDTEVDFFLHDSLHTYDHTSNELNIISEKLSKKSLVCCDNLEKGSGLAFNEFLSEKKVRGACYNNFGYASLYSVPEQLKKTTGEP